MLVLPLAVPSWNSLVIFDFMGSFLVPFSSNFTHAGVKILHLSLSLSLSLSRVCMCACLCARTRVRACVRVCVCVCVCNLFSIDVFVKGLCLVCGLFCLT